MSGREKRNSHKENEMGVRWKESYAKRPCADLKLGVMGRLPLYNKLHSAPIFKVVVLLQCAVTVLHPEHIHGPF
jgi:hypothetical protein